MDMTVQYAREAAQVLGFPTDGFAFEHFRDDYEEYCAFVVQAVATHPRERSDLQRKVLEQDFNDLRSGWQAYWGLMD